MQLPILKTGRVGIRKHAKLTVSATARPMDVDEGASAESGRVQTKTLVDSGLDWLDALHRFSRPHTIIGSVCPILSIQNLSACSTQIYRRRDVEDVYIPPRNSQHWQ